MEQFKGIEYLRHKLNLCRPRVLTRYNYYNMKHIPIDRGKVIPDELKWMYQSCLGWCAKSVDSLADRLVFDRFENDVFNIGEIFKQNNQDIMIDSNISGALIGSCSFIYISRVDDEIKLQAIDGYDATGIIDPITGLLKEGYAVLERDENNEPLVEAYFLPNRTIYFNADGTQSEFKHSVDYPLLVPVIYRPDATRNFGHSRISRSCMNLQDKAANVLTRSDVTAEFYSFPQKWVSGTSPDSEPLDKWKATVSTILEITKDADGDKPTFGQFVQQSMTPHIEQFRMYASIFAGETGLTLDDLGFVSGNPASVEAIKAAHETLRLTARKAQKKFATGFKNAGFVAACLRDDTTFKRNEIAETELVWMPLFEPDAAMLGAIGDGAIKINQAVDGYFGKGNLQTLTGIRADV